MKRTLLFSILALALMICCQRAFAYDFVADGIYYTELPHQDPGGGCGETTLMVVNADHDNTYSGDIVIPETVLRDDVYLRVTNIGNEAFYNCPGLTSITLPDNLENIGFHGIAGCPQLNVIYVPAGMTQINSYAFADNANLDYIFILDTEPFFLWNGAFSGINSHCKIAVPCGCLTAFENDSDWASLPLVEDCGGLLGIEGMDTTTLSVYPNPASETLTIEACGEALLVDESGRITREFFVNGKKTFGLQGLARGVYFLKVGKTVKKVLVQ